MLLNVDKFSDNSNETFGEIFRNKSTDYINYDQKIRE